MSTPRKLRCFVAMAFGYEDTDYIYDQWIKPAVEAVGLIPVRVDRIIHNDRIDARIREELIKANVVIADLTYSRPSVYWEAGFAERNVPVIYTCRKDHFSALPDDKLGNHKVHFDLANANIATWSNLGNKSFKSDLTKRLRFVTADLRRQKERELEVKEKRLAFAQKSLDEKMVEVSAASFIAMLDAKYSGVKLKLNEKNPSSPNDPIEKEPRGSLFWKRVGATGLLVSVHYCYPKFLPEALTWLYGSFILSSIDNDRPFSSKLLPASIRKSAKDKIKRIRQIKFIPILSTVSERRIQDNFSGWRNAGLNGWYYFPQPKSFKRNSSEEMIFISNIKSPDEFTRTAIEILEAIEKNDLPLKTS